MPTYAPSTYTPPTGPPTAPAGTNNILDELFDAPAPPPPSQPPPPAIIDMVPQMHQNWANIPAAAPPWYGSSAFPPVGVPNVVTPAPITTPAPYGAPSSAVTAGGQAQMHAGWPSGVYPGMPLVNPYDPPPPQVGYAPRPMPAAVPGPTVTAYPPPGVPIPNAAPEHGPITSPPGQGPDKLNSPMESEYGALREIARLRKELGMEQEMEKELKAERDTWACSTCTFKNKLTSADCEMCGATGNRPKGTTTDVRPPPQAAAPMSTWTCTICCCKTNPVTTKSCSVCGTSHSRCEFVNPPKSTFAQTGTQWSCTACTFLNSPQATTCAMCTTVRTGPAQPRPQPTGYGSGQSYPAQGYPAAQGYANVSTTPTPAPAMALQSTAPALRQATAQQPRPEVPCDCAMAAEGFHRPGCVNRP